MENSYIKSIKISGFWGKYNIVWDNLDSKVNILVGINGSGKSTLLNIISEMYKTIFLGNNKSNAIKKFNCSSIEIIGNNFNLQFPSAPINNSSKNFPEIEIISTFDVPVNNKKTLNSEESPLMQELKKLIVLTGTNSFNDYRLRLLSTSISYEDSFNIKNNISNLFEIINRQFINTGKSIEIDETNNIVFRTDTNVIQLNQLSSGEKQLLLILFKVFLTDKKPYILLMDEPEISLHLSWQQDLIQIIHEINPNCQIIIATHSPGIFGKGWHDRITFMEKLFL